MAQIDKRIPLPGYLIATLKVSSYREFLLWGPRQWHLEITVPGPDRRYNPGRIMLRASTLPSFIGCLEQALVIMKDPTYRNIQATHTQEIGWGITVNKGYGNAAVTLATPSETHRFSVHWPSSDLEKVIVELKDVSNIARELSQQFDRSGAA